MKSAIGKAYTSESANMISLERIFADLSALEGLGESELLVAYDVLPRSKKFKSFSSLLTQLKSGCSDKVEYCTLESLLNQSFWDCYNFSRWTVLLG